MTDPDLVQQLSEAGHHDEAAALATKLGAQLSPDQARAAKQAEHDKTPAGQMNRIIRGGGGQGTGDINADLRRAGGHEVTV
jgi:RecG-like helicase